MEIRVEDLEKSFDGRQVSMSIAMMRLQRMDDLNGRRMVWGTSQVFFLLDTLSA